MALNGTKLGLFNQFQCIFILTTQRVLKLIFKSPRFVPFGANVTQFGANPDMHWFVVSGKYPDQGQSQIWPSGLPDDESLSKQ